MVDFLTTNSSFISLSDAPGFLAIKQRRFVCDFNCLTIVGILNIMRVMNIPSRIKAMTINIRTSSILYLFYNVLLDKGI